MSYVRMIQVQKTYVPSFKFLTDRSQSVKSVDSSSKLMSKTDCVPQGPLLGPFLLLFYINDLPSHFKNSSQHQDEFKQSHFK